MFDWLFNKSGDKVGEGFGQASIIEITLGLLKFGGVLLAVFIGLFLLGYVIKFLTRSFKLWYKSLDNTQKEIIAYTVPPFLIFFAVYFTIIFSTQCKCFNCNYHNTVMATLDAHHTAIGEFNMTTVVFIVCILGLLIAAAFFYCVYKYGKLNHCQKCFQSFENNSERYVPICPTCVAKESFDATIEGSNKQ